MNIVVAHARLHGATAAALDAYSPPFGGWDAVPVAGSLTGWWDALAARWGAPGALVNIDHDVEIHAAVLPAFATCPSPWCSFPYRSTNGHLISRGGGCMKLSQDARRLVSPAEVEAVPGSCWECQGTVPGCWRHVDGRIAGALEARGITVCTHLPSVTHHHGGYCGCEPRCA